MIYLGLSVLWLINVAICVWLGIRKDRLLLGAILGVFITSAVGILIMLLIPPKAQEHWGLHNADNRAPTGRWSQPQKEVPFINKRRSTNVRDAEVDA
jgi:hypothetical protein